jgi:hypothetical protein
MRKQFDELVETMKRWDLYQENDEVDCALNDLESAIDEVEKRMICAVKSAKEINETISKYTEEVDKSQPIFMSIDDHDLIQNCSNDVDIALDMGEDMCVVDNWYNLFSPKEEPIEEFLSFESSWGIITCAKDGVVISVDGDLEIGGERNYLFDIAKFDLEEYKKFLNSIGQELDHYFDDILSVGFWRKDNTYNEPDFEWRKSSVSPEDDEIDVPTELAKPNNNEIVNNIISQLKDINVDGETMSRIVSELGFDEYLMKSLMMSRSNLEIIDNLAEKEKINGY